MESFRLGFAIASANVSTETRRLIDKFIDDIYQYENQT